MPFTPSLRSFGLFLLMTLAVGAPRESHAYGCSCYGPPPTPAVPQAILDAMRARSSARTTAIQTLADADERRQMTVWEGKVEQCVRVQAYLVLDVGTRERTCIRQTLDEVYLINPSAAHTLAHLANHVGYPIDPADAATP